ncbi:glycosyltransferase [Fulvimarina endophytica]|uniref:Glycosyltransferase n=1 Tax=Fulvimarina endophytica TaxID=2293836 RepID=A0A371X5T8_9HYPH|nr:TIGR04283 family arsenosugar biosynthesis glycosyltransferase [Fulvimarina endophytica]RFC64569.1 glycosyltransferase [Fulvimarina endophytica]
MPVLDEASGITAAIESARRAAPGAEILVADGGSTDATAAIAAGIADRVIAARRGRARQMNDGAASAAGTALLFLHADTRLPEDAGRLVLAALDDGADWGRFDVTIEGEPPILRLVAAMMNRRSRLTGVSTGDQAIFVARRAFEAEGGFPDIPLMEDVALSKRLRRLSRPACLAARVSTSGRRWEANGPLRTIATMWALRLAYWCGAHPARLAAVYGRLKSR